MRKILQTAIAMTTCLAAPVLADMSPVVVELYTSQGCSSCPPADELLTELSARDDVIALALHVDYWDYIGWVDEFADPSYTQRQQGYARAAGETTIYTPQFVIAGSDTVVGARGMEVIDLIAKHRAVTDTVDVELDWSGDMLTVVARMNDGPADGGYIVQLAQILPATAVEIRRGENAGKTITYSDVVQTIDVLGEWDGVAAMSFQADVTGANQVAVIVQHGAYGPVVGAAKLIN